MASFLHKFIFENVQNQPIFLFCLLLIMQQMLHTFKQWTFPLNAQSYEALSLCSTMWVCFTLPMMNGGPTHNHNSLLRLTVCVCVYTFA